MTHRENSMAILRYEQYDRMPVVHFGFWEETLEKWRDEGHLTEREASGWSDGNEEDHSISAKLGFDFNWYTCYNPRVELFPEFERVVLEELGDGRRKVLNKNGAIELESDNAGSIPAEFDHTLKDRASWEEHYKRRLEYGAQRVDTDYLRSIPADRELPLGLYCGSMFGNIRNWLGVEGASYLYYDDEELFDEMIETVGELSYRVAEKALLSGARFDFAHFWEDICFKNGPLVIPSVFREKVGPQYKRITGLLSGHGVSIVSVDCDGLIDALIPTWLKNGVNTMFPIEVGTWNASIAPWREKYGRELRGVGGMDKRVFAADYAAVDAEIERLKPLVALGGYIPCPDHRIAPDAKWENVQYYCEKMRRAFG